MVYIVGVINLYLKKRKERKVRGKKTSGNKKYHFITFLTLFIKRFNSFNCYREKGGKLTRR